ncbi:ribonuclease H-like domain-containing protein [Tanacetum coccineum]
MFSTNTARPVNTVQPRTAVNNAGPMKNVINNAYSTARRPLKKITVANNSNFTKKVNTVKGIKVNTARPKAVLSAVKGNKGNAIKASTCWVWRPKHKVLDHGNLQQDLKDKGVIDSGCSRHMRGNKSYLTDYEEIDGGFVAFGGNSKGGKITGKGKIRTGKLDFEDVYFVKELKFNLFSVSQMCDKKNNVLFSDTECVVLSPDFKLIDESHVLLKVPRKDNMYNVDLMNVVPQGGITCLFAKATSDESNLWHMRLGYVNFKTMNKLVRENLVRGLPSNFFEINQTCVACQKEKQHRASYALTNSINYKPVVAGNQSNGNAGTKACDDASKARMDTVPGKDYILLPLWAADLPFSSSSKDSSDAGFKPSGEEEKKDAEDPGNEGGNPSEKGEKVDQEKDANVNSTNNINTVSPTVNAAGIEDHDVDENIVYGCADDPNMPDLEEIDRFSDAEDYDSEADINNLDTYFQMTKNLEEYGFVSTTLKQRTSHKDLQNCLFACFLSQEEPKKVVQALKDPSWIEAMQEELLQFKLQDVWTLVELPNRKRVIGTKWVFKKKKDERGIVIKNKIDVKSAFLYGKIKEEVYVCQPPGFEDPDFPDRVYKVEKTLYRLHQATRACDVKTASTPIEIQKPLLKDADGEDIDEHLYRSMIGSLMYLTSLRPDIMFATKIHIDNESIICIVNNPVFHSKTKHIETRHHFIRDSNENKLIQMIKIHTDQNVTDLLTKAFDVSRFQYLIASIGMLNLRSIDWGEVNRVNMQRIIHKGWLEWNATTAKDGIRVKTGSSRVNIAGHYLVLLGKKNADFAEISDFLNANPIWYALTVSHTIYVSCIEQFWSTPKTKTVNNETQIHAKVEGKTIVISESSVRRDLQFNDEGGTVTPLFSSMLAQQADMGKGSGQPTDPQHTSTYAQPSNEEQITASSSSQPKKTHRPRKAKRATEISQSSGPISPVADEAVNEERRDSVERAATTATRLDAEQDSGGRPRRQEIMGDRPAQTRFESLSKQSYDSPLGGVNTPRSDEDRIELKELMEICTKLSKRVLDLETTKSAQAKEIANLKKRVKKMERKRKSRTSGMNLFKIGTSRRRSLGEEDASKQGKQSSIFEDNDFDEGFDANIDEAIEQVYDANKDTIEEGEVQVPTADMEVNTASAPVTTTGVSVTTAEPSTPPPPTTTTIIEDEELTIS